jgi:hypothetical protein
VAGVVTFIESVSGDGGDPGGTVSKVFDGSTVTGWVSSASVATNSDNFLTGTTSVSDKVSNSTQTGYGLGAGVVGEPWDFSVGGTDEDNHIFMIINAAGTRDTLANGGYGIIAADDLATDSFGTWYVGPQANSQGGWEYFVIDPAADFDAVTAGSATWTLTGNPAQLSGVDGIGVRWKITNTVMGASDNAYCQSGSIGVGYRITGTDAVFSEISTYENTNRFGALETKSGTLFPLCKIRIGTPSGAGNTTFSDAGFNVTWQGQTLSDGTTKASRVGFYGLFADQGTGTTDITLDGGSLAAASPEEFDLDLSGVNSVTCDNLLVDRARLVTLDSAVTWNGGTVKNSGQVTATDAIFNGLNVLTSSVAAGSGAVLWNSANDPDGNLDDGVYVQGTNAHSAIEFGTLVTADITIRNCDFTGFGSTDDVNGAVFKFLATTGSLTLNLIGCTTDGAFSVDDSAGIAVTVNIDPVTVQATIRDENAVLAQNVRVLLKASDATGDLPFEDTVTITRSGAIASVVHTAHGMINGDVVVIAKTVDQVEYSGAHVISNVTTNGYDYTVSGTPTTPATGTIVATGAILDAVTNASGVASRSRTFTSATPLIGTARMSTTSPRYKPFPLSGTVSTTTGLSLSAQLIRDD